MPSTQLVFLEGLWGMAMMVFLLCPLLYVAPGSDRGRAEDTPDTLVMLANSRVLVLVGIAFAAGCAVSNVMGVLVTGTLSGVHRLILDAVRTGVIWAFGLVVRYGVDRQSAFGEEWTSASCLKLLGFVVLVVSQAVYGGFLRLPGLRYEAGSGQEARKDCPQSSSSDDGECAGESANDDSESATE